MGIAGGLELSGSTGKGKRRRRLAGQHGDGMFKLRPLDAQSDILRLRGFELSLGFRHGFVRADAGLVLGLGEIERLLISDHG